MGAQSARAVACTMLPQHARSCAEAADREHTPSSRGHHPASVQKIILLRLTAEFWQQYMLNKRLLLPSACAGPSCSGASPCPGTASHPVTTWRCGWWRPGGAPGGWQMKSSTGCKCMHQRVRKGHARVARIGSNKEEQMGQFGLLCSPPLPLAHRPTSLPPPLQLALAAAPGTHGSCVGPVRRSLLRAESTRLAKLGRNRPGGGRMHWRSRWCSFCKRLQWKCRAEKDVWGSGLPEDCAALVSPISSATA